MEGKAAEVIAACYTGAEAMLRLVHKDKKNTDIPAVLGEFGFPQPISAVPLHL